MSRIEKIARRLFELYPTKDGAGNEYCGFDYLIPTLKEKYLGAGAFIVSAITYEANRRKQNDQVC